MKTYRGIREPLRHVRVLDGAASIPPPLPGASTKWHGGGRVLALPRELVAQATAPFDWGQDGPGTHYLAVALLADLLGPADRAGIKSALPYLRRFLSRLPKDDFEIADTVFRAFVHAVSAPAPSPAPRALPGMTTSPEAPSPTPEAPHQAPRDHAARAQPPLRVPRADGGSA